MKIKFSKSASELILKYDLSPKYLYDKKTGGFTSRPKETRKVYLRGKAQASENVSIVLYTSANGKREIISTGNVLNVEFKEGMTDRQCKEIEARNKETMHQAQILADRYNLEVQLEDNGLNIPSKKKSNLCEYINTLCIEAERKSGKKGYYKALSALKRHIINFSGEETTFKQINREYCKEFLMYIKSAGNFNLDKSEKQDTGLTPNTQNRIYRNLNQVLNSALKANLIKENPLDSINGNAKPKAEEGTREFLSISDVKKLIATPCKQIDLKRAFIFSCLTGLRFSDISKLTWKEVRNEDNETSLHFRMQKTQRECVVYVSDEAKKWMPERGKSSELLFKLASNYNVNKALAKWAANAGVTKKVTFHVARHTCATLSLSLGNSIEVVSDMLGHTDIKTTKIYAKVLAESKKKAVAKQNGLFD